MTSSLAGKTIAVTGGFGALGRAVGDALQAAGAQVALIDKAGAPANLSAGVLALPNVDLGQADDSRRTMDQIVARFGALDGLANIAGGFKYETVESGSAETWDRLYALNVRTALLASQAALPHLLARGGGRIVNVGANAAAQAGMGMGAYAASKSGVARLTEAMAEEFKDRGITVNAVLPSILDTPANRADMPKADPARWVSPAALAQVIVFLLSDAAAPITGALIPVKGRV
ncbi:MAG TPA: SDR family NAD(P)-dependent oxidoreductase [Burkholderiaceae bacterium]|nr:SDR family NAD(P)-dependent oxidoreductase [Burkholderiaceae bacterium]